jgi:hypothetical protein
MRGGGILAVLFAASLSGLQATPGAGYFQLHAPDGSSRWSGTVRDPQSRFRGNSAVGSAR